MSEQTTFGEDIGGLARRHAKALTATGLGGLGGSGVVLWLALNYMVLTPINDNAADIERLEDELGHLQETILLIHAAPSEQ
jgi:hypothetical protein